MVWEKIRMVIYKINCTILKNRRLYIIALLVGVCASVHAWNWWPLPYLGSQELGVKNQDSVDSLYYMAEVMGVASSGQYAPFFLQHNRNGNIAALPFSGNVSVGFYKPATAPTRWFDYDFGVQLTGRVAGGNTLVQGTGYFNQFYAHARLLFVDMTAGITPYHIGPQNDNLTSGGLLFSQNAHPLPRVTVGIERYTPIPGLYGYLEVRGGLTHAWMNDNQYVTGSYMHHAFAGARIGGKLPVRLSYEFHHVAQWGGYSPKYGDLGNDWHAFLNAVLARSGGSMAHDQLNAQGNHIGSQMLTLEVNHAGWHARAYWQTLFEDGPIRFMMRTMNLPDGLWGVHVCQDKWSFISGLTYEFLNTTDQSGPYHDRDGFVYGGADSYFTNGIYANGWNYFLRTIGSPYITSPLYDAIDKVGVSSDIPSQTTNNRVQMHFVGLHGDIYGYRYRLMASYAMNYGTYRLPQETTNTALLLEVSKHVEKAWGLDFSVSLASDIGSQFGNSLGVMVTVAKRGLIVNY